MEQLDTQPWYQQFWPWALMSLPAIAVVGCMITIVLAIRSNDGLVQDNYYKEGLAINQAFDRDDRATALKLAADVLINPEKKLVEVRLSHAINNDVLELSLVHATIAHRDQLIQLKKVEPGIYRGSIESLSKGKWYTDLQPPNKEWRLTSSMDSSKLFLHLTPKSHLQAKQ